MNEKQSSITWQKILGFSLMFVLVIVSAYLAWMNVQMQRHMSVQMSGHMDEDDMDMHDEDSTAPPMPSNPSVVDNDTSDWQSYTDSKYGYSFKYPRSWKMEGKSFSGSEGTLNINVNLQALGFECYEKVKSHRIIYDGYDGVDSIFQGVDSEMCDEAGKMIEWMTLSVGDNVYDISFAYAVNNENIAVPLFGEILDTFEFTNAN